MRINPTAQRGIFRLRSLFALTLFLSATLFGIVGLAAPPGAVRPSLGTPVQLPPSMNTNGPSGPGWSIVTSPYVNGVYWGVTCASSSDCWIVAFGSVEHWDGTAWTDIPSGQPFGAAVGAVTCVSSTDCWAVGNFNGASLIERWDGTSWNVIGSPNVPTESNTLVGISCASAPDCWAVGYFYNSSQSFDETLVEHWDGSVWSIVASPNASGANRNFLYSVFCNSSSDCWAVGDYYTPNNSQTLIEHWDGSSWTITTSPNVGFSNFLSGVTCASSSQCWAVGFFGTLIGNGITEETLIEGWDGNSWKVVSSPNPATQPDDLNDLNSVSCPSVTECWAVGYSSTGGPQQTLIEHWDGNSWSLFPSPNAPAVRTQELNSIACSSTSQCWAVGWYEPQLGVPYALIEEYSPTVPPVATVASRMTHGTSGTFDLNLPLTGSPSVECRSSNALGAGNYSIVFSFVNAVSNCGTAANTGASVVAGPNANQCTENLTGISDGQTINVELDNLIDNQNNTGNVSVPMGVLFGDVSGDGVVNVGDSVQVRNHAGEDVSLTNFRYDLNADGAINVGDTAIVRSHSGDFLP